MSDHHHHHSGSMKMLSLAILLTLSFAIIEAVGGYISQSLALLGDAGHMGSDALALCVALMAAWIAKHPPSEKHSYGLGRAETIAAMFSSLLMIAVVIYIVVEAIERFQTQTTVTPVPVIIIAIIGLIINILIAWLLSRGEQTLNIRAALLHVIGDILGSIAALASGVIIYYTHWMLIDPILSILIALLIAFSSIRLLMEGLTILMEGVPHHLQLATIKQSMAKINEVENVHDLHVWTLTSGKIALSAHIDIKNLATWDAIYLSLKDHLNQTYGIHHITLQPETQTMPCLSCDGEKH